ncbi:MAG: glycogen debranching protein [Candidatus Sericytochromatia bacterium]|nr:MAG: glycogen debranching protein [Candidatus Sericytochromatia bacterium]
MRIEFDINKKELSSLIEKEYLLTNGLGSFSSSTIINLNTRKYHGLFIVSKDSPVNRYLLLSNLEEIVIIDNKEYQLGNSQWSDESISPQGYKYLKSFILEPYPTWIYEVNKVKIIKSMILFYAKNILQINYKVENNNKNVSMKIFFLVNDRNIHDVTKGNSSWYFTQKQDNNNNNIIVQADVNSLPLCINFDNGYYYKTEVWYYKYLYKEDKERGLSFIDDNYNPGFLDVSFNNNNQLTLTVSTEIIKDIPKFDTSFFVQTERIKNVINNSFNYIQDVSLKEILEPLIYSSDNFIVKRNSTNSKSIIAGYHWFSDWGRDSMISLTGLTLVTKRFNEAKSILKTFVKNLNYGLIPNYFNDRDNTIFYNSVDSSLWLFYAIYKYLEYTNDDKFLYFNLYNKLRNIIDWYIYGTKHNIKIDWDDYLIIAYDKDIQLTWMDAKLKEDIFTQRGGKPVEVNILWFNALKIMELLSQRYNEDYLIYKELSLKVKNSIVKKYWNEEYNCLYDNINIDGSFDNSIRPNQIFAISLPFNIFDRDKETLILKTIEEHLLTPYGLRTLSPKDKKYIGKYEGNVFQRDSAYHNGTVWAWLIGPFITSFMKIYNDKEKALQLIKPLIEHFNNDYGIANIAEIFDGDFPHKPKGCIAQAWSIAELIRCIYEDIYSLKPILLKCEEDLYKEV